MSKFLQRLMIFGAMYLLPMMMNAQQLTNANFEDWSAAAFSGEPQPKGWNASNVEQLSLKFNFAHKEAGRGNGYCMMVQDQDVGAVGITETSPGYFALGKPWVYIKDLTSVNQATAGTSGGISWKYRPDSMSVWIKRTGNNTDKEDFYLLYYSWSGTAKGEQYKGKNGSCTSHAETNEESDVRQELNGNECGTVQKANQIAEGMWRQRKTYGSWTNIRVPIYYFNNDVPSMMNIIFSASNYPNYRANNGLYAGNSLYVDDVELIYSSRIQKLYIDNIEWRAFDPNSTEIQRYSLGESATSIPDIKARRGAGSITNARGKTVSFPGRELTGSEITIVKGDLESTPTTITVKSEDGKSSTTYRIQFQRAPSSNATLAEIAVNGELLADFRPGQTNYNVELPYGTTKAPVVTYTLAEDAQTATVTQAASPTGKATIVVTAADKTTKKTYTLNFSVGLLKDVTLQDIKVNGKSIPGFTPAQAVYKVSLPVGTSSLNIQPVSAYPAGEQTVTITPNPLPTGEAINGASVQVSVSAPGAPAPKVYKLNIKLEQSSYSYLADLQVVGDQIADVNPSKLDQPTVLDFDPEVKTYFINLKMGTEQIPYPIYTPGDEYQTIKVDSLPKGAVDGTVRVIVVAGNGMDQTVYKLVYETAKSEISTLLGIKIDGQPIPDFRPDSTSYPYELPVGTTKLPSIEPIAHDEFQKIKVDTAVAGVNGKTRISVTAGNGSTTNYYILFSVKKYRDNTLKNLSVAGYDLQDADFNPIPFDPQRNEYFVRLDNEQVPAVSYEQQSTEFQTITVTPTTSPNGKYKIKVTPRDDASRTYIIQFVYKLSENTKLNMIYINDSIALPDFDPEKTDYTFTLDTGTVERPKVTWDSCEVAQEITAAWEWEKQRTVRITVKAENRMFKRTYKIKFYIPSAASTQLANIRLVENGDTTDLPGFSKDKYEYSYMLKTPTCPAIIAVPAVEKQQVTITSPYAAGTATILVRMEDSHSQYSIEFVQVPATSAQLTDILVNGESLKDKGIFVPTTLDYDGLVYSGERPTVKGIAEGIDSVPVFWKDNTAKLFVEDAEHNKAVYSLTFTRQYSNDNTLEGIYADSVLIDGFDKSVLSYEYNLPAGSTYPAITYQASETAQVIFFGQLADGKWGITVMAEDGESTVTYTVQYIVAKYNDATLIDMSIAGMALTPAFDPNTFAYTVTIDEGAVLPELSVVTREGQTVSQSNVDKTHQQVIVYADGGASNTYTITYTRVESSNALLADILIDGVSIEGFDPYVENYVDSIAWRSKFVPNVFPVGQVSNQTITTYFSRPDGVTRIHVEAQNGATKDYTVSFPVRKSSNTLLGDLYLDSEEADIKFKATQTDYEVILPYEATACPKMVFEKAETEQRIDLVSRPIGQTSQIIVTAENGDTRTYNILFKREVLKTKNLLSMLRIVELDQEVSLRDKTKRDFEVQMPYGSRSMTLEYEKSYPEQTVFIEPGGIYAPTVITVKANNDTVQDEVYTITPVVPTQNPAVLESITVNGKPLAGFDKNKFSYIVPLDVEQLEEPIVMPVGYNGALATPTIVNHKHYQVVVSKSGITSTYNLWFYYTKDKVPNAEFTNWTTAKNNDAPKPTGWNCLADYFTSYSAFASGTHTFGKNDEVTQITVSGSNKGVQLSSKRSGGTSLWGGALGGILPAWITLGTIEGSLQEAGGSTFNAQGGITFRNTPDVMLVRAKTGNVNTNGDDANTHKNRIVYQLSGNGSANLEFSTSANTDYKEYPFDLAKANRYVTAPTQLNIILNSFFKESMSTLTQGSDAMLTVDYIHFTYNHKLSGLKVDNMDLTPSGNAFTATLTDPERVEIPVLKFTGEVEDQAQTVTWAAPTKDANYETRTATIRNFAENGTDYTDYTLTVKRPLDEKNQLAFLMLDGDTMTTFQPSKTEYIITLSAARRNLPDIQPLPASSLQKVTTAFHTADSTMTITVTPEKTGVAPTVYTVRFRTAKSNDVTLANISAEGLAFDAETTSYEITADVLPVINFEKKSDLQTVSLINGLITVTAEDGTVGTYTITRVNPAAVAPNGTIAEFTEGTNLISGFGDTDYSREAAKPTDYIAFVRQQASDSVIFVQDPTRMTWSVPQTGKIYTWTYSTSQSANTNLAGFTVDGVPYADFTPGELEYELISDTTVLLAFLAAEEGQTLTTSFQPVTGGVEYATVVTAANGTDHKTYTVKVTQPLDGNAQLAGILLDDVMLPDFDPSKSEYTVTLPVGAYKVAQPKMPNVTYLVGHKGQTVVLTAGELNDEATEFVVTSEDGKTSMNYYLTILAEKSHCAELTGIIVNGTALEHFEPGRHFYSVSVNANEITVDYTSDDRFLTVTPSSEEVSAGHEYRYTLHVMAEDGTTSDYYVEIYVENRSNDAQLANILLNGKSMDKFEPQYNHDLFFDGGNNNYEIKMPSDGELPEISAQLKLDGQTVDIEYRHDDKLEIDSVLLTVTAVDGTTRNVYTLRFVRELSTDSHLQFIEINNILLPDFEPTKYFYQYSALQTGEAKPRVTDYGMPHESAQVEVDDDDSPITIIVHAQDDSYVSTYTIVYEYQQSKVATLEAILLDDQPLTDFTPENEYYTRSWSVDSKDHKLLEWVEGDELQTVTLDTVEYDIEAQKMIRRLTVQAEDTTVTKKYWITTTIRKSSNDSLLMIYIGEDHKPIYDSLEEWRNPVKFHPDTLEYRYTLTAKEAEKLNGAMPIVEGEKGDDSQDVNKDMYLPDKSGDKSLAYKQLITVTAAAGNSRTYIIQYPIKPSSENTLNMILIGGKPLKDFDSETDTYSGRTNPDLQLSRGEHIPVVTVVKKEEAQTYHIFVDNEKDIVTIDVWAEDGTPNTYTLTFERVLADIATIDNIILTKDGKQLSYDLFDFAPDTYDYTIVMPYDSTITDVTTADLPDITVKCDSTVKDTVFTFTKLSQTDIQVTITLIAENGDEGNPYTLLFRFTLNNDASLVDLKVNGVTIKGFKSDKLDYTYKHPYGSDSTDFFLPKQVEFVKADPLATDYVYQDEEGVINITITAHDGKSQNTYSIRQVIGLDTVCTLDKIVWEGGELPGFDPEVTFYTYLLSNTASSIPTGLQGITTSPRSRVSIMEGGPNDTTLIICIAQDSLNYKKEYRVLFKKTEVNDGIPASSEQEVFIRRVKGASQLFVSTIRSGVAFALYDQTGRMVYFCENLPYADPNDVDVAQDGWNKDVILNVDVDLRSGIIVDINPRQIYFYSFTSVNSKIIKSGKLIALP